MQTINLMVEGIHLNHIPCQEQPRKNINNIMKNGLHIFEQRLKLKTSNIGNKHKQSSTIKRISDKQLQLKQKNILFSFSSLQNQKVAIHRAELSLQPSNAFVDTKKCPFEDQQLRKFCLYQQRSKNKNKIKSQQSKPKKTTQFGDNFLPVKVFDNISSHMIKLYRSRINSDLKQRIKTEKSLRQSDSLRSSDILSFNCSLYGIKNNQQTCQYDGWVDDLQNETNESNLASIRSLLLHRKLKQSADKQKKTTVKASNLFKNQIYQTINHPTEQSQHKRRKLMSFNTKIDQDISMEIKNDKQKELQLTHTLYLSKLKSKKKGVEQIEICN